MRKDIHESVEHLFIFLLFFSKIIGIGIVAVVLCCLFHKHGCFCLLPLIQSLNINYYFIVVLVLLLSSCFLKLVIIININILSFFTAFTFIIVLLLCWHFVHF